MDGGHDYKQICTDSYLHWQSPSVKVAPVNQPWPFSQEEDEWDEFVLAQKKKGLEEIMSKRKNEPAPEGEPSLKGKSPCQVMNFLRVEHGFNLKQWKVRQWEHETGLKFTEEYQLPSPGTVFNCSEDKEQIFGFDDDTLLAGNVIKDLYIDKDLWYQ